MEKMFSTIASYAPDTMTNMDTMTNKHKSLFSQGLNSSHNLTCDF